LDPQPENWWSLANLGHPIYYRNVALSLPETAFTAWHLKVQPISVWACRLSSLLQPRHNGNQRGGNFTCLSATGLNCYGVGTDGKVYKWDGRIFSPLARYYKWYEGLFDPIAHDDETRLSRIAALASRDFRNWPRRSTIKSIFWSKSILSGMAIMSGLLII